MDPRKRFRIRIHTLMSWIRNTASNNNEKRTWPRVGGGTLRWRCVRFRRRSGGRWRRTGRACWAPLPAPAGTAPRSRDPLKGLAHEKELNFLTKKLIVLGLNKDLYWFLNFKDEFLMSYCISHFPHG
jgi:hypothetical protein